MMYFLYDIIVAIVLVLSIPVYLYRAIFRNKIRRGIRERFGFISREKVQAVAGFDVIWVHAVSVGETMAARPLLKALRAQYPQSKIVLSQVTETGRAVAEKLPEADVCVYLPFDIGFSVKRAVSALHPKLVVVVETEIWPNFFKAVRRSGAAIVIANARISDRSFPRYRRFRRLLAPVLADVSYFCAQSTIDAERLVAMGADPGAVAALGNLKYDVPTQSAAPERVSLLRKKYHLDDTVPIIVAASTHAGEEAQFLEVARSLGDEGAAFLTIVVPRHPERTSEVVETARKHRFNPVLRSRLSESSAVLGIGDLLIIDTIGELMDIYPTAHVVFMGGSLVPVGGHNILEPASVGKPVIFGPHMHNFRDIGNLALKTGAGWQVSSSEELGRVISPLLTEPERAEAAGAAALAMVAENGGATCRHMEILQRMAESCR